MEIHASEQEQLEEIKKWWSENGRAIILGIFFAIVGLFGWQSWGEHQQKRVDEASQLYSTMLGELEAGQYARINDYADEIAKNFDGTAYASLSALAAAKANVKLGKLEDAKARLQWVTDHAQLPELVTVARLRLIALHLTGQEFEQADALLKTSFPEPFKAMADELKGDLLVAQGNIEEAKFAYDQALAAELPTQKRQLIQLKRDELGAQPLAPEPSA